MLSSKFSKYFEYHITMPQTGKKSILLLVLIHYLHFMFNSKVETIVGEERKKNVIKN